MPILLAMAVVALLLPLRPARATGLLPIDLTPVEGSVTSLLDPVLTLLGFSQDSGRPFTDASAWNSPIVADPVLQANSRRVVAHLSSGPNPSSANLKAFGVPTYDANASTPRYSVECTAPWGACELEAQAVPVPEGAVPSPGSDGAMVVIDWSTGKSYEFWKARFIEGTWRASWGGVSEITGDGRGGEAVGSGISRLAGVVRTFEINQGSINHALVFSTDNACQKGFRYPATKTDGLSTRSDCIPEGARIQLDPSIDVAAIPGITSAEKLVARALQVYGAYAIDNGGARMAYIFETPSGGEVDPYPASGLRWDYYSMDKIPWDQLRVLRTWNGLPKGV